MSPRRPPRNNVGQSKQSPREPSASSEDVEDLCPLRWSSKSDTQQVSLVGAPFLSRDHDAQVRTHAEGVCTDFKSTEGTGA